MCKGESRIRAWDTSYTRYVQQGFQACRSPLAGPDPKGSQAPSCVRDRRVSSSKWHSRLCQQQPRQLHASWEGIPEWSVYLLGLSEEFKYSRGPVCWTCGIPTVSPSFIPRMLSVSFACPGWPGVPESVSCPGMPSFTQCMGLGPWKFLKSVLEVGGGEWRRLKLGLVPPSHLHIGTSLCLKVLHGLASHVGWLLNQVGEGQVMGSGYSGPKRL